MDWNSFFSTIAQSSAAIVGIISAFIIAKIINNQNEHAQNEIKLNQLILESQKLKSRCHIIARYNKDIREQESRKLRGLINADLRQGKNPQSAEIYYSQLNYSPYDSKNQIIDIINDQIENQKRTSPSGSDQSGIGAGTAMYAAMQQNELKKDHDAVENLLADIRSNIKEISAFLGKNADTYSINTITISIIATLLIFYVGVIYPTIFLPVQNNMPKLIISTIWDGIFSIKGFLLSFLIVIFSFLMIYFLRINLRLKINVNSLKELQSYTEPAAYFELL